MDDTQGITSGEPVDSCDGVLYMVKSIQETLSKVHDEVHNMNINLTTYNGSGYEEIPEIVVITTPKNFNTGTDICANNLWHQWCGYMADIDMSTESIVDAVEDLSGKQLFTKRGLISERKQAEIYASKGSLTQELTAALKNVKQYAFNIQKFLSTKYTVSLQEFNEALHKHKCTNWLTHVANMDTTESKPVLLYNVSAYIMGSRIIDHCSNLVNIRRITYSHLKRIDIYKSKVFDSLDKLYEEELAIVDLDNKETKIGAGDAVINSDLLQDLKKIITQYNNAVKRDLCVVIFDWPSYVNTKVSDKCEPPTVYTIDNLMSDDILNSNTGITDEFMKKTMTMTTSNFPHYIEPMSIREVIILNGPDEYEWKENVDVLAIRPYVSCKGVRLFQSWGVDKSWARRALLTHDVDTFVESFYNTYNEILIRELKRNAPKSTGMLYRSDIESVITDVSIVDIKRMVDEQLKSVELPYGSDLSTLVDILVNSIIKSLYEYMWNRIITKECSTMVMEEITLTFNVSTSFLVKKFRKEIVDFLQNDKTDMSTIKYAYNHKPLISMIHTLIMKANANIVKLDERVIQKYYTMIG